MTETVSSWDRGETAAAMAQNEQRTVERSTVSEGKTNLDFTETRDSEWQWNPLGHMQVCTLLQTNNHASTPLLSFYRLDADPAAQPTVSKHWRHYKEPNKTLIPAVLIEANIPYLAWHKVR